MPAKLEIMKKRVVVVTCLMAAKVRRTSCLSTSSDQFTRAAKVQRTYYSQLHLINSQGLLRCDVHPTSQLHLINSQGLLRCNARFAVLTQLDWGVVVTCLPWLPRGHACPAVLTQLDWSVVVPCLVAAQVPCLSCCLYTFSHLRGCF